MSRILAKAAVVAVALAACAGAARAADIEITIRTSDRAPRASYYGEDFSPPRAIPSRQVHAIHDDEDEIGYAAPRRYGYAYRDPNRYYGRPVAEGRSWSGYGGGYAYGGSYAYGRPVAARPHWGGDCRVIVKHTLNRWGEQVVKRTTVCD